MPWVRKRICSRCNDTRKAGKQDRRRQSHCEQVTAACSESESGVAYDRDFHWCSALLRQHCRPQPSDSYILRNESRGHAVIREKNQPETNREPPHAY